jgi:lysophospholipase L1-like esterase
VKTILCYGDSLTWGYNAEALARHPFEDRWPNVLQAQLGGAARVIEDGLNGRTTAFDDNLVAEDRNGARTLPTSLATHSPLDLVIVMLGANDMKPWIHGRAFVAANGMARLVNIVRGHTYFFDAPPPKIIMVSPPPVSRTDNVEFSEYFDGANESSTKLADTYRQYAGQLGCGFFDAGSVARTSPIDGVHLDAENTRAIGKGIAPLVRETLGI